MDQNYGDIMTGLKTKVAGVRSRMPTFQGIRNRVAQMTSKIPTAAEIQSRTPVMPVHPVTPLTPPQFMVDGKLTSAGDLQKQIQAKARM